MTASLPEKSNWFYRARSISVNARRSRHAVSVKNHFSSTNKVLTWPLSLASEADMAEQDWVRAAVARHEGPLLAYVARLTGDAERSRDIVQDAFAKLCQQSPAELDGRLAAWLYAVARNRAVDLARKETRMTALTLELPTRERSPAETLEVKETAADVMSRLAELPALQQEAVRLKFQQQFSYREIAEVMNTTVSHVGVLLHEALKKLRTAFHSPIGGEV
jgi:RNA polymerase sigma-70 factor (ECF subfamily)